MWDELLVAALIDPSVMKESETTYLDADIDHGPEHGDTVVWKQPSDMPQFFLPYSGLGTRDRAKWVGHLTPPAQMHPPSVEMKVDVEKFENLFVELMSHSRRRQGLGTRSVIFGLAAAVVPVFAAAGWWSRGLVRRLPEHLWQRRGWD